LAEAVLEFLPEMVNNGIRESNTQYRRQLLERLTQTQDSASSPTASETERESDIEDNPD
jgi:hypothetical protein